MLTNLIMRGVIKGEEWVARHFISAHLWLPCGTVLSLPETLTHTHTRTHIQSCILLSRAHFSLATDKLGCTISCSKLSTAKRAPVSSVAVFEEKWIRVAKRLVMTLYSHQNSMITTQCIY